MMAWRSKGQIGSRSILAFRILAATCVALASGLLLAPEHVSADAAWRPRWAAAPSFGSAAPWEIEQQAIVEVEVQVHDREDVILLQSLGYTCGIGVCRLELPAGGERNLLEHGLAVQVVARAIRVTGMGSAAAAEAYEYDDNYGDVAIPDDAVSGCGTAVHSDIVINTAPAAAVASTVWPGGLIAHTYVGDLKVWLQNGQRSYTMWNRYGGTTDGGYDDDSADDDDIYFNGNAHVIGVFAGDPVNQTWRLYAQDCVPGWSGKIDYWSIAVYYDCASLTPHTPSGPSPADGATNQPLTVDLDWADATHAIAYDVYLGTTDLPPQVGTTTSSHWDPGVLYDGGHFRWKIVARNKCAQIAGPLWDFTTCVLPSTPSNPSPGDGATGVSLNPTLSWASSNALGYSIYFGTTSPPPWIMNTASTSYTPGTLASGTHYFWRIVALNGCGNISSPEWSFTTASLATVTPTRTATPTRTPTGAPSTTPTRTLTGTVPAATPTKTRTAVGPTPTCSVLGTPASPSPANGATGVAPGTDLDWADTAGATAYTVHFGTSPSPPYHGDSSTSDYDLSALSCETHYYWQVIARDACASSAGPLWGFTTASCQRIYLPVILRQNSR